MKITKTPSVLFLDDNINLEKNKISEGGTFRFSQQFNSYFKKNNTMRIVRVYFKESDKNFLEKISQDSFFINFDIKNTTNILKTISCQKDLDEKLSSIIELIERLIEKENIKSIFLNGFFGLFRYATAIAAKNKNIYIVIQHAGIWKKEIKQIPKESISRDTLKVLLAMDNFPTQYNKTINIFLNNFSKKVYELEHKNVLTKKNFIIALPIELPKIIKEMKQGLNNNMLNIGVIARWDAIKNHSAVLRLATSSFKDKFNIKTVTKKKPSVVSNFRKKYEKNIEIIAPMSQKELSVFYRDQDIVFLPSHFDVSPTVFMESLLQGIPVILSKNTGWIDLYKKYKLEQLLVNPKDSGKKIYQTIRELLDNYSNYRKKFTKIQKDIIKNHEPKRVFKQYEKIFTSLIKK